MTTLPKKKKMSKASLNALLLKHKKMLEYQKQIAPFTPTIRELLEVFETTSTFVVSYNLNKLVERGLCIYRAPEKDNGHRAHSYYAIEGGSNETQEEGKSTGNEIGLDQDSRSSQIARAIYTGCDDEGSV